MNQKLLHRLKTWRIMQAKKEGVELFRVLPNATIEDISRVVPRTTSDFLNIKGIKESRWKKYGAMLSAIVGDFVASDENTETMSEQTSIEKSLSGAQEYSDDTEIIPNIPGQRTLYTVSAFLEALNILFAEMTVRIQGEVSSVDIRDKTVYFTLKDSQDASILSCLIFRYQYEVSGVTLQIGQEVIVEGIPGIWKPTGRLSLKAQSIEVSGVGALQKAYDDLKQKLEREGMFASERKRIIPEFSHRIALITSNQGAAIGDFLMNLGKHGFHISLLNANVEGKRAVYDLIEAVRFFNRHPERYDVLVIIRGGGSLESLQAFNNEMLVREVATSNIPTLCGIGHEKDVSLTALAGDWMVSTPTATARYLREGFERAGEILTRHERNLIHGFSVMLQGATVRCEEESQLLTRQLRVMKDRYARARNDFFRGVEKLRFLIWHMRDVFSRMEKDIMTAHETQLASVREKIGHIESKLAVHDPKRVLRLGYGLIMKNGKIVKNVGNMRVSDDIDIYLNDGMVGAVVHSIHKAIADDGDNRQ